MAKLIRIDTKHALFTMLALSDLPQGQLRSIYNISGDQSCLVSFCSIFQALFSYLF